MSLTIHMKRTTSKNWGISSRILKIWYLTVIERIILYCSAIWAYSLKTHEKRLLISIQRSFLLMISRSYRTTSNDALHSGIPPLDLTAEREAVLARVLRLRLESKLWNIPYDPFSYETRSTELLCHLAQNGILCAIRTTFSYESKSQFQIYTDGSHSKQGTGCGQCVIQNGKPMHSWRRRLRPANSIFQAELLSLKKAVYLSSQFPLQVEIYSDSLSSLEDIKGENSRNTIVAEIKILLLNLPAPSRSFLSWVPAHREIYGNELTDQLAKGAVRGKNLPQYSLPLPFSYIKRYTKENLLQQWQKSGNTPQRAEELLNFYQRSRKHFWFHIQRSQLFSRDTVPFRRFYSDFILRMMTNVTVEVLGFQTILLFLAHSQLNFICKDH
ncbi:uncharacterized protein LOC118201195 [Stegodyphus dumicola]|uniref:uncharacterized protein LOC118201195 n=1 Tax=Stegodyphus dumicola TaxID=202533 RepID=UPI0015A8D248|nr:uncharacterized protein LOC118201195 [Stegodyphus dumicola]